MMLINKKDLRPTATPPIWMLSNHPLLRPNAGMLYPCWIPPPRNFLTLSCLTPSTSSKDHLSERESVNVLQGLLIYRSHLMPSCVHSLHDLRNVTSPKMVPASGMAQSGLCKRLHGTSVESVSEKQSSEISVLPIWELCPFPKWWPLPE